MCVCEREMVYDHQFLEVERISQFRDIILKQFRGLCLAQGHLRAHIIALKTGGESFLFSTTESFVSGFTI